MTKVIISEDCGNSPKNIFLQKLTIALAKINIKFLLGNVTDDIHWNIVGNRSIQGKDEFSTALKGMKTASELRINHIATHGKAGAVDGEIKFESGRTYGFCDVFEFNNTKGDKIKAITSYVIEIKE